MLTIAIDLYLDAYIIVMLSGRGRCRGRRRGGWSRSCCWRWCCRGCSGSCRRRIIVVDCDLNLDVLATVSCSSGRRRRGCGGRSCGGSWRCGRGRGGCGRCRSCGRGWCGGGCRCGCCRVTIELDCYAHILMSCRRGRGRSCRRGRRRSCGRGCGGCVGMLSNHYVVILLDTHLGLHIYFGLGVALHFDRGRALALDDRRVHDTAGGLQTTHHLLEHAHGRVRLHAPSHHNVRPDRRQLVQEQEHAHQGQLPMGSELLGALHCRSACRSNSTGRVILLLQFADLIVSTGRTKMANKVISAHFTMREVGGRRIGVFIYVLRLMGSNKE